MRLSEEEKKARAILIKVAQGTLRTHKLGLIGYKEFWLRMSDETWGQGKRGEIVGWITRISGYDLARGRPPLNELVVLKGTEEPGEE
ncbi:hypothetical protein [uncultured Thiodictyon sp.]|uniref:hypothetical protein n=1 Tax=uncultured Thiodictyon sp. TaxID=1846217 RepID=UPI0025EB0107|nr:hypothetical protein [uncultured Thiodictyon sp.]